jgi:hypothetical protein
VYAEQKLEMQAEIAFALHQLGEFIISLHQLANLVIPLHQMTELATPLKFQLQRLAIPHYIQLKELMLSTSLLTKLSNLYLPQHPLTMILSHTFLHQINLCHSISHPLPQQDASYTQT